MPQYVSLVPIQDQPFEVKIFNSWPDCEQEVSGKPGAFGRKFPTLQAAEEFAVKWRYESAGWQRIIRANEIPTVFVDGSCTAKRKDRPDPELASWGLVVMHPWNGKISKDSGIVDWNTVPGKGQRQVAGEFFGAYQAARYAEYMDKSFGDGIILCFDYWGICFNALGLWEPKNPLSKWYFEAMQKLTPFVKAWRWTPGHTGIQGNEIADQLAGDALKGA